jgi:AcrR family transcriptional regulator
VRSGRTQAERRASSERRLLDAAAKVIAERGTTSVSFADIAREAGCSHGLPGYIFGSKTDLLLALVDDVLREFRVLVGPAVGGRKGLPALLETCRIFVQSLDRPFPYTRAVYVMIGEAAGAPPELRKALNSHQDAARQMIVDALVEGIEMGQIRPDVEPAAQAVVIFGILRGVGLQSLMDPASVDVEAVTAEMLVSVERALAADEQPRYQVEANDHADRRGQRHQAQRHRGG